MPRQTGFSRIFDSLAALAEATGAGPKPDQAIGTRAADVGEPNMRGPLADTSLPRLGGTSVDMFAIAESLHRSADRRGLPR
jgi:hypothetical protein